MISARAGKPRDKVKVESAVLAVEQILISLFIDEKNQVELPLNNQSERNDKQDK